MEEIQLSSMVTPPEASTNDNDERSLKEQERRFNEDKRIRYNSDTRWRCRFSWWVIGVDSGWLLAILIILFLNNSVLHLADSVLIVLLGTTTVNVIGLAFIVLKGLFGFSGCSKSH